MREAAHCPAMFWFPNRLDVPPAFSRLFVADDGSPSEHLSRGSEGPEEKLRGVLASPYRSDILRYEPNRQRWTRIEPGVWVGADREAKPEHFKRTATVPGVAVKLADGNHWVIPVANPFVASCSLPTWDVFRDGEWTKEVRDCYADISLRAADLAAAMREKVLERETAVAIRDDDVRALIADALSVNYRVDIYLLSALRVFSTEACNAAVHVLVDWAEMEKVLLEQIRRVGEGAASPFGGGAAPDSSAM